MENDPNIILYRAAQAKRLDCMNRHEGADSAEEDDILDELDSIWWILTKEEEIYVRANHGPSHKGIIDWLDKVSLK